MSLLDRLGRGHLGDPEIARLWTSSSAAPEHPHLATCAACRARYEAFACWLSGIGEELRAEADEAFPADRLAIQQAQIARRLETLERPARVIAFPKAARAVISGNSHVRRWVTVAAAASLIAGFGLGQVVPLRTVIREKSAAQVQPHLTAPEASARAQELTPVTTSLNDDELLSDAFARSRVTTLSALDEMTPHARDLQK
ncbi:MAG TPA: hypothetical protein VEL51_16980 [Vicinamibacterales bacterium]|nr:hypothetical protein [Vicinamibacterales bacterium]